MQGDVPHKNLKQGSTTTPLCQRKHKSLAWKLPKFETGKKFNNKRARPKLTKTYSSLFKSRMTGYTQMKVNERDTYLIWKDKKEKE